VPLVEKCVGTGWESNPHCFHLQPQLNLIRLIDFATEAFETAASLIAAVGSGWRMIHPGRFWMASRLQL
jgi:hypothetical protein